MPDATAVTEENLPAIAAPPSVLDELGWRGLVALTTDEDALAHALAAGPITAYCGFDPTAPSLHFGNLVQLIVLRHLQRSGHRVICLVGGSTGLIGDPRPTAERVLKTKEQTAEWVARIQQQVRPFLDFDGDNPAIMVNNLDWTAPMSALDFLREIGKHFRVNTMLRKDAVAARLAGDEGISYTEFSYQLLQGMDYLHLFRAYGCTLQTGGQDQWGNLTAGADLIRKATGESVHLLATPLITDSHGQKFGKSEGNAVWLSAEMTSPYTFYQYWLNVEDASVGHLLRVFTDRTAEQVESLERELAERPQARTAQRTLAGDVTTLVHGAAATQAAIAASAALFGRGDLVAVDEPTLRAALTEAGLHAVSGALPDVAGLFVTAGLVKSLSEARRVVAEGGANINNIRVSDVDHVPARDELLHGRYLVVRRGKRSV
ncbi:MAG TPA: tyrosine--tRNA ligase, partial [Nakamurella sp.]